jgi:phenylacetate-CoA ligase
MDAYFDNLETRDHSAREAALFAQLSVQVRHARETAPYYHRILRDVDAEALVDRAALATLPVTRKSDLIACQRAELPFGGLVAVPPGRLRRIFQSPGPIYDAEGHGPDAWRTARAFHAAGFRPEDIIHNTFSYHLTPAGVMVESGAEALGCAVIPAGTGNSDLQVRVIEDVRPRCYAGTPSFLRILISKARELGADISSLKTASVAAEALPPRLRAELNEAGIAVTQWYATADLGLIAYESSAMEGMIVDEGVIVEIVRPGTGDALAEGEVGEVVVTTFSRDYPLIRFATGDLSAVLAGQSPCGRTNMRLKGWLGRADQTAKVKGMFVHPSQVAEVTRRHPGIVKARLVVSRQDEKDVMTLYCAGDGIDVAAVARTLQMVCTVSGRVELSAPDSLPNDGKVIDDIRTLD